MTEAHMGMELSRELLSILNIKEATVCKLVCEEEHPQNRLENTPSSRSRTILIMPS